MEHLVVPETAKRNSKKKKKKDTQTAQEPNWKSSPVPKVEISWTRKEIKVLDYNPKDEIYMSSYWHTYIHTHICMCTYIYIYTHIHLYKNLHT